MTSTLVLLLSRSGYYSIRVELCQCNIKKNQIIRIFEFDFYNKDDYSQKYCMLKTFNKNLAGLMNISILFLLDFSMFSKNEGGLSCISNSYKEHNVIKLVIMSK